MADVVAVEDVGVHAEVEQFAFERARDRAFAGAAQAGEPDDRALVAVARARVCAVTSPSLQKMFLRFRLRAIGVNAAENDAAAGDLP